ncbi:MAG TPA: iron-containing alcohol dehydrogenase, partial [Xenococcaceae cyanobacterium]
RYAEIADYLHLGGDTLDEKVEKLITAIDNLKVEINIPLTIKEVLPGEEIEFYEQIEELAEQAFDDQCTGSNPRYPLIKDLKELYTLAYRGCKIDAAMYHPETNTSEEVVLQ